MVGDNSTLLDRMTRHLIFHIINFELKNMKEKKKTSVFGLQNSKYCTEQYKKEQHNTKVEQHMTNFYGIE